MEKELEEWYPEYVTTGTVAKYCGGLKKGTCQRSGSRRVIIEYRGETLLNSLPNTV